MYHGGNQMSEPTKKAPEIENLLDALIGRKAGRITAIRTRLCIPEPIGCGRPVGKFRDQLSAREYDISGLCQECQDKVFQPPEDE